jgi:hypothetical protein|tara:strand:+ start:24035 stop:24679 length:645 start_codon:yes stop_codon:yes gene_type:complete
MPFESFFPELSCIEQSGYGKTYKYYPASTKVLLKLKPLSKVIGKVITVLTDKGQNESGSTTRRWESKDEEATSGEEVQINPVSESMAAFRLAQKEKAIDKLIDILLAQESQHIIGYMLITSLREEFADLSDPTPDICVSLITDPNMSVDLLKFHLTGILEANKKVLGPLAERVSFNLNSKMQEEKVQENEALLNSEEKEEPQKKKKKKINSGAT